MRAPATASAGVKRRIGRGGPAHPLRGRRSAHLGGQHSDQRDPLTLGQVHEWLVLANADRDQEPLATGATPSLLAHQQVADLHAVRVPRAGHDHFCNRDFARCDLTLEACPSETDLVCVLERSKMLLLSADHGGIAHQTSPHFVQFVQRMQFPGGPAGPKLLRRLGLPAV
jgi:hypothetical protein